MGAMPASRYAFGSVPWYSMLIVSAIVIGLSLCSHEQKRLKLPADLAIDLALCLIPSAIVGARLYYVAFSWDVFAADPLRILRIWEGGLAIYGGILGGAIALLLFCAVRHMPLLQLADVLVPALALGQTGEYNGVKTGQNLKDDRSEDELLAEALQVAKDADYVIFFGGLNKSSHQDCEDSDRVSLGLPYAQDRVISELAKVNKNLIVVNISGNAVAMPWVNEVPAIGQGWFLGSEAGTALASVLVGDANPSGKLPFTFPAKLEDVGAHKLGEYPGNKEELAQSKHKGDTINEIYRICTCCPATV